MQELASSARLVHFGPFVLDLRSGELRNGSTRLKVPSQSIEILKALLEQPGELVTREALRSRLWPSDTFVDFEHGLNAAIRRLREALGDSADTPSYIETLPRRGYRFIGTIDRDNDIPAAARTTTRTVPAARTSRTGVLIGLIAGAVVIALGIGLWIGRHRTATLSTAAASPRSVPVTSFPGREVDPAISPDGNHVAFAWDGDKGGNLDIYVKLIDGGAPIQLTTDSADDRAPAWSPDGKRLAFLRTRDDGPGIVVIIPSFGGAERRLEYTMTTAEPAWTTHGVSWTPDGRSLVFAARSGPPPSAAIFATSIDTDNRRQLTWPGRDFTDAVPRISPDGRQLAFVRRVSGSWSGFLFIQQLDGLQTIGEARRVTDDPFVSGVDWFPDSRTIAYERQRDSLWRVATDNGRPEVLLPVLVGVHANRPSVARDGSRVLFQRSTGDRNIWKMASGIDDDRARLQRAPVKLIASTFEDAEAQFSPDGQRIVFDSPRSGTNEIFVSASDGTPPLQVTTSARCGCSPRWSPDGRSIAFDSKQSGSWNIYVVSSQGGDVRALTADPSNNARASWSQDGRWIYFGSTRTGASEIWKVPASGGPAVQVTRHGGFEAFESSDGTALYYTGPATTRGIWRVPVSGGEEVQVVDHGTQGAFAVTDKGVFVVNFDSSPTGALELLDFKSKRLSPVATLPPGMRLNKGGPTFHVSRDGRWILYTNLDDLGSDIAMLEVVK